MITKTYNPEWLALLAENQCPEEHWLPNALRRCTEIWSSTKAYCYFITPENANKPGAEWQFDRNIILVDEKEGDIVLDILKENRIGGIEFLSRI